MINERTLLQLDAYIASFPHAALFYGQPGVDFHGAVAHVAKHLNVTPEWVLPEKKEVVDLANGIVSIDSIRRLYEMTKTRSETNRLIVIDKAATMTHQAQNAFLKLLEEPSPSIHFILLSSDSAALLPTIVSRSQSIEILPISLQKTHSYLDSLGVSDQTKRTQLIFLANGLPQLLQQLATDEEAFDQQKKVVSDARTIIQGSRYDALHTAHTYKDDRSAALQLIAMVIKLLEGAILREPKLSHITRMKTFLQAYEALQQNGNVRLHLTAAIS